MSPLPYQKRANLLHPDLRVWTIKVYVQRRIYILSAALLFFDRLFCILSCVPGGAGTCQTTGQLEVMGQTVGNLAGEH